MGSGRLRIWASCAAASLVATATGCGATWKPLDVGALERAKPRTLLLVYKPTAPFLGPSRNPLVGGMVAAVAMGVEGHRIRDEHHVADPTHYVADAVALAFAQQRGLLLEAFDEPPPPTQQEQRNQIVAPPRPGRPTRDLYLEVGTTGWGVDAPFFGDAIVYYAISAKLIDHKTHQVLAAGDCGSSDREAQRAARRSYDDVLAHHAAIVKHEIDFAVKECLDKLSTQLLLAPAQAEPRAPTPDPNLAPPAAPDAGVAQSSDPE